MDHLYCLRCQAEPLQRLDVSDAGIEFFECSACRRQYALRPGKGLTYRWGHPISLALYGVIFDESPADAEQICKVSAHLQGGRSDVEIAALVKEIRFELSEPTQQVRDILDCRATEQKLRLFLQLLCDRLEKGAKPARR